MIKIEKIDVNGFESAIRGMRNPLNSWDRSDSAFGCSLSICDSCDDSHSFYEVGDNDLDLMHRLFKGGTEHRKYLRFITVTMDITAPLYWWKEFDTYKVGTVANSCSTMHKIHAKEFELDDFSCEHLTDEWDEEDDCGYAHSNSVVYYNSEYGNTPKDILNFIVEALNHYRKMFLETKDKKYWWNMIQLLPSSYNQKRTVMLNYEVAVNIIRQRKGHKLDEWHVLVDELMKLPYLKEIAGLGE